MKRWNNKKGRHHYLGLGDHVSYAGKQQIKAVYAVTMIFARARSSFLIWFDGHGEKRFAKLDDNKDGWSRAALPCSNLPFGALQQASRHDETDNHEGRCSS